MYEALSRTRGEDELMSLGAVIASYLHIRKKQKEKEERKRKGDDESMKDCTCDWNDWFWDEKRNCYRCKKCFGKARKEKMKQ